VGLRNWLFEINVLRSTRVSAPVISVGNVSAGGVGKTPIVEFIAKELQAKKRKVAVLSRGYGRKTRGYVVVSNGRQRCAEAGDSGDEPAQLAEKLDGIVVAVDEQRVRGAQYVIRDFGVDVIVLDDGFQHRYLRRDLDIVIVSAEEVMRPRFLLPAGRQREGLAALGRAHVIGVSRCKDAHQFESLRENIRRFADKPMFGFRTRAKGIVSVTSAIGKKSDANDKTAVIFSGIGNPTSFGETVNSLGWSIRKQFVFTDHHWYKESELETIEESRLDNHAAMILTTEKDVARLKSNGIGQAFLNSPEVGYVEIEAEIIAGQDVLWAALLRF
jgi:tetraacyldisaccharide 4'-kinase